MTDQVSPDSSQPWEQGQEVVFYREELGPPTFPEKVLLAVTDPDRPGRLVHLADLHVVHGSSWNEVQFEGRITHRWRAWRQYFKTTHPHARRTKSEYHRRRR